MLSKLREVTVVIIWCSTWFWVESDSPVVSIWPSLVALSTVLLLQSVITGLLVGATSGTLLLSNGNLVMAFISFFDQHLIPALQSKWNVCILVFTLFIGGFVALIEHGGGMLGILAQFLEKGRTARHRVQWAAFLLGILCFFDGLANSMLVGRVMSPIAAKAGVSREKLSYIVDSTSSPVACIAFISTWIAYQLSMIQEGLMQLGVEDNAYLLFLRSIPHNYYCLSTLVLIGLVISNNFNIGPMRTAENAKILSQPAEKIYDIALQYGQWYRAVVPLVVFVVTLMGGLYISGTTAVLPITVSSFATAVGNADTALVLVCASAFASIIAFVFNSKRSSSGPPAGYIFLKGMSGLFVPLLILVSAWCLSSTLKQLETSKILAQVLSGNLSPKLLPAAVFFAGTLISFTTGTSWGTMGVLMPLALPVAITLTGGFEADYAGRIVTLTIAAVFSGAVFGDHCSPISDTTIVSSIACDIKPIDHVQSQLPYAVLAATLALFLGFLPIAFGASYWIFLVGLPSAILVLWKVSKPRVL